MSASPHERPTFSVVIPTHHGERWLAATLDSLVAQTRSGFECILIDSSTTNETLSIAEGFRDKLELRVFSRPDIGDWQGKTNLGVELARGSHVCMLHQDDVWEPRRAAHVEAWIAEPADPVMHIHSSWIIDDLHRRLGVWRCPLPVRSTIGEEVFLERLIVQNFVAICAPVIKRSSFVAVGGLDRTLWYTADWDLYLKLGRSGSIVYHPEVLAGYRIHATALTTTGSRRPQDLRAQMSLVLDRHLDAICTKRRPSVEARARASIAVNTALAAALHGGSSAFAHAALSVLALGPLGIFLFLRDTRLKDRLVPRLRSHWAGRLAPERPRCGDGRSSTAPH